MQTSRLVLVVVAYSSLMYVQGRERIDPEYRPTPCRSMGQIFRACQSLIPMSAYQAFQQLPVNVDMDETCVTSQPFHQCLQAQAETCSGRLPDHTDTLLQLILNTYTYVCSEEGKPVVEGMMQSPCNNNNRTLQRRIRDDSKNCEADAELATLESHLLEPSNSEKCRIMDELIDCSLEVMTTHCGSYFGDFFTAAVDILRTTPGAWEQIFDFTCPAPAVEEGITERLMARALRMLR